MAGFRIVGEGEMRPTRAGASVPIASRERVLPGETFSTLLEIEPAVNATRNPNAVDLRVRATCLPTGKSRESKGQSPYYGLWPARIGAGEFAATSVDFRFAAAMAAFGEALQTGPEIGAARLNEVERWARSAVGEDAGGYRAELIATIEQARRAARR